jgi:tRNA C32,U32 (ribose-2'-O)-methylase TrmJ
MQIVAATEKADTLLFDADLSKPTVIVMGNEENGISKEVLKLCDCKAAIPMVGAIESLNVSASAAILIYMFSQRIREQVDNWQLSDSEKLKLLTRWTMSSVRDYERILHRAEENGTLTINE